MRRANERHHYTVTTSLIGWAQSWTDSCNFSMVRQVLSIFFFTHGIFYGETVLCNFLFLLTRYSMVRQFFAAWIRPSVINIANVIPRPVTVARKCFESSSGSSSSSSSDSFSSTFIGVPWPLRTLCPRGIFSLRLPPVSSSLQLSSSMEEAAVASSLLARKKIILQFV